MKKTFYLVSAPGAVWFQPRPGPKYQTGTNNININNNNSFNLNFKPGTKM